MGLPVGTRRRGGSVEQPPWFADRRDRGRGGCSSSSASARAPEAHASAANRALPAERAAGEAPAPTGAGWRPRR